MADIDTECKYGEESMSNELIKQIEDTIKEMAVDERERREERDFFAIQGIPSDQSPHGNQWMRYQKLLELEKKLSLTHLKLQSLILEKHSSLLEKQSVLLESNADSSRRLERATKRLELLTGLLLAVASLSLVASLLDLLVKWGVIR